MKMQTRSKTGVMLFKGRGRRDWFNTMYLMTVAEHATYHCGGVLQAETHLGVPYPSISLIFPLAEALRDNWARCIRGRPCRRRIKTGH